MRRRPDHRRPDGARCLLLSRGIRLRGRLPDADVRFGHSAMLATLPVVTSAYQTMAAADGRAEAESQLPPFEAGDARLELVQPTLKAHRVRLGEHRGLGRVDDILEHGRARE